MKKLLAILMIVFMLPGLTACGDSKGTIDKNESESEIISSDNIEVERIK